jgi:spore germination protein KA
LNIGSPGKTLPDTTLKTEIFRVGVRTKTSLAIIYVESLAEDRLVSEVRNRISKIDIDGVIANGYVEAFIEDNPYSPFPQVLGTEKPDKVVAAMLEGRIAILLDRTPFVLLVPAQFIQFFQAPEDYYERFHMGYILAF